jgi:type VI secretion system protein ImpM
MQTATAVGFYGKLPCNGDFLERRVPRDFLDAWDPWLQECMHASRRQLERQWLDAYLTGPVWRFALAEGVCGSGAYAGVVLPSVDKVGRYFPLTVVVQLSADECLLDVACEAARGWFEAAESLAILAVQHPDLDVERFDAEVGALVGRLSSGDRNESSYLRDLMRQSDFARRPARWMVPLASTASLQCAALSLAARELERSLRPLALWWTDGSVAVSPCWLCTRGLPPSGSFVGMLAGDWIGGGWESLDDRATGIPPGQAAPCPSSVVVEPELDRRAVQAAPAPRPAPIQIVATAEAAGRIAGEAPNLRFVSRPDLGLWGFSCDDAIDGDGCAAQQVADVLYDVTQAGSLTQLVEETRRALERVRAAPAASTCKTRTALFLARGEECALLCSGEVQALRVRSGEAAVMLNTAGFDDFRAAPDPIETGDPPVSLMDLITSPSAEEIPLGVRYEELESGDVWVLAAVPPPREERLTALAAAVDANPGLGARAVAAVGSVLGLSSGSHREPPLMLLAARAAPE